MENSVGIVETKYFKFDDEIQLECKKSLKNIQVAYETYGKLNAAGDNAILVCHALTADAHAAGYHSENDRKPGWWDTMIGQYFRRLQRNNRPVFHKPRNRKALRAQLPCNYN